MKRRNIESEQASAGESRPRNTSSAESDRQKSQDDTNDRVTKDRSTEEVGSDS
jgi:hypothetical protein